MSGFEMRTQQQNKTRICIIGRRTVQPMPERVSGPRARRADVGVTVVAVNSPGVQHALVVNELVAGTAHVVHDFVLAIFLKRTADPSAKFVEHGVPGHALPFSFTALARTPQRIKDTFRVIYLIDGCRSLRAIAATAS